MVAVGVPTPRQVVEALRRHVDPAKITVIKAGGFAKGEPKT